MAGPIFEVRSSPSRWRTDAFVAAFLFLGNLLSVCPGHTLQHLPGSNSGLSHVGLLQTRKNGLNADADSEAYAIASQWRIRHSNTIELTEELNKSQNEVESLMAKLHALNGQNQVVQDQKAVEAAIRSMDSISKIVLRSVSLVLVDAYLIIGRLNAYMLLN